MYYPYNQRSCNAISNKEEKLPIPWPPLPLVVWIFNRSAEWRKVILRILLLRGPGLHLPGPGIHTRLGRLSQRPGAPPAPSGRGSPGLGCKFVNRGTEACSDAEWLFHSAGLSGRQARRGSGRAHPGQCPVLASRAQLVRPVQPEDGGRGWGAACFRAWVSKDAFFFFPETT